MDIADQALCFLGNIASVLLDPVPVAEFPLGVEEGDDNIHGLVRIGRGPDAQGHRLTRQSFEGRPGGFRGIHW